MDFIEHDYPTQYDDDPHDFDIPLDDSVLTPAEREALASTLEPESFKTWPTASSVKTPTEGVGFDGLPDDFHYPPEGAFLTDEAVGGNLNDGRPIDVLVEQWEFREAKGVRPGPANLFRLAREARAAGHDPYAVEVLLVAACGRLRLPSEKLAGLLRRAWAVVETAAEPDGFVRATRWAALDWSRFPSPGLRVAKSDDEFRKIGALAFWLHVLNGRGGWFPFPRDRIAGWLRKDRSRTGDMIRDMAGMGVFELTPQWRFKAGLAREARYTGPDIYSRGA